MSAKERDRLKVQHAVQKRHITQVQAAQELGMSARWVRTLLQRMRAQGNRAVVHRLRGRPPDDWLTIRCGRRGTFSRELQDGHELFQGKSEDLLDFDKRVTLSKALKDAGQRHPSAADNPHVAAFSR